jgi:hypothetical protein
MKTFYFVLLLGTSVCLASAQTTGNNVSVIGIINGFGLDCAVLTVVDPNHEVPITNQIALSEGQSFWGTTVRRLDAKTGVVTVDLGGEMRLLRFQDTNNSGTNAALGGVAPAIRLRGVLFSGMVGIRDLYAQLKDRNVLEYPGLGERRFSLTANPQNKAEAVKVFEQMFEREKIAIIPDGRKFVMLVPYASTNSVMPLSDQIHSTGELLAPHSMNLFGGVPLDKVLELYGQYQGRPVNRALEAPCCSLIYFVQQTPLSKEEICYALETLFAWNGIRLISNGDKSYNWEVIH